MTVSVIGPDYTAELESLRAVVAERDHEIAVLKHEIQCSRSQLAESYLDYRKLNASAVDDAQKLAARDSLLREALEALNDLLNKVGHSASCDCPQSFVADRIESALGGGKGDAL